MSWMDLLKFVILATWLHILMTAQVSNYMKLKYGKAWAPKTKTVNNIYANPKSE